MHLDALFAFRFMFTNFMISCVPWQRPLSLHNLSLHLYLYNVFLSMPVAVLVSNSTMSSRQQSGQSLGRAVWASDDDDSNDSLLRFH